MDKYPNLDNLYYLYCHYRNDNGQPFYIGVGKHSKDYSNPSEQYKRSRDRTGRNIHWKRIVAKVDYTIEILCDYLTHQESKDKETEFISLYKRHANGGTLCNITLGGDGTTGVPPSARNREIVSRIHSNTEADVDSKVYPEPNTGCWLWGCHVNSTGGERPIVTIRGKSYQANRYLFQRENGVSLTKKDFLISICECKYCVNPAHHYVGTQKDVTAKRVKNGKHKGTSSHKKTKLTEENVKFIRSLYSQGGVSYKSLANTYGVSSWTIADAIKGRNWGYLV